MQRVHTPGASHGGPGREISPSTENRGLQGCSLPLGFKPRAVPLPEPPPCPGLHTACLLVCWLWACGVSLVSPSLPSRL